MIRYLHTMRAKKGFTMVELIIVIAIIAVLAAMVFPLFSNDDAKRDTAEVYASDFYASLQYCMTRYQKTDYHINTEMAQAAADYKADNTKNPYIVYDETKGQNVCAVPHSAIAAYNIYLEAYNDRGIKYVKLAYSLQNLLNDTATTSDIAAERLLQDDLEDIVNDMGEGYYYAVINYDSTFGNFKVLTAHYCEDKLPAITNVGTYKDDNLMIVDEAELDCGISCGTCSSDRNSTGSYVGSMGTYFLNVDDIEYNGTVIYTPAT